MTTTTSRRIVRVMDRLNVGGPAIHAILLSQRMNGTLGWMTTLVTGREERGEASLMPMAEARGVVPVVIPALGREIRPLAEIRTLWRLLGIMRRQRPDVVHTHKSKAGVAGRLAAWLCDAPLRVHTFHGHVLHGYFSPLKSRAFILIERLMALLSHKIIAVSPRVKDDLVRYRIAPADKIVVVPLGLELARFAGTPRRAGALRAELGARPDQPLVGIVARLCPIKSVGTFLEAAAEVLRARPDCRFVVVGDGESGAQLRAQSERLGLAGAVRFLGFRSDLEVIYSDLDVLALTSLNEGSPVSLIEGLASGCAVVATDVGGVSDVVRAGTTGVLVPPCAPARLAEAIMELLKDDTRRRALGEAGRRDVVARYSIDRLVADLDALYRRGLDNFIESDGRVAVLEKT